MDSMSNIFIKKNKKNEENEKNKNIKKLLYIQFFMIFILLFTSVSVYAKDSKTNVEIGINGFSSPEKDTDTWTGDKFYFGKKDNITVLWDVIDSSESRITAITDDVVTTGPYMGSSLMTPKWSESYGVKKMQQIFKFNDIEKTALASVNEDVIDTSNGAGDTNKTNPSIPQRNLLKHKGFEKASARKKNIEYWLIEPHAEDGAANCIDKNGEFGTGNINLQLGYVARLDLNPQKIAFLQKYGDTKKAFGYVEEISSHVTWQVILYDNGGGTISVTPDPGKWTQTNNLHIEVVHPSMSQKANQTSMILMSGDKVLCYGKIGDPNSNEYYVALPKNLDPGIYEAYVFDEHTSDKAMGETYCSAMAKFQVTVEDPYSEDTNDVIIVSQPQPQVITVGETATFEVVAKGAVSYQWYVCSSETGTGSPIAGATKSTYTTTGTKDKNGLYYYCIVKGQKSSVETVRVKLTVGVTGEPTDSEVGISQPVDDDTSYDQKGYDYGKGGKVSGTTTGGGNANDKSKKPGTGGKPNTGRTPSSGKSQTTDNTGDNQKPGSGKNGTGTGTDSSGDKSTIRVNGSKVTAGEASTSHEDKNSSDDGSGSNDKGFGSGQGGNGKNGETDSDGSDKDGSSKNPFDKNGGNNGKNLFERARDHIRSMLNPKKYMGRYYSQKYLYEGNLAKRIAGALGLKRIADGFEGKTSENGIEMIVTADGRQILIHGKSLLMDEGIGLTKLVLIRGNEENLLASYGNEAEIEHVYIPDKNGTYTIRLYNSEGSHADQKVKITGFHEAYNDDADFKFDSGDFFFDRFKKAFPWLLLLIILIVVITEIILHKMKRNEQEANENKIFKVKTMQFSNEDMDQSGIQRSETPKRNRRKL